MPHSHHSHSGQFCKHAAGNLEHVVHEAIRQNFQVFGLTEHVPRYRTRDLYPEEVCRSLSQPCKSLLIRSKDGLTMNSLSQQFCDFLDESHRLKYLYSAQIHLLVGIETEYISPTDLDQLQVLLSKESSRIQFIVGSVHHVNQIPIDFDEATFLESRSSLSSQATSDHEVQEIFFSEYLDAQYELITRFRPEVIGHLDLCRLYTPDLRFEDYPGAWAKLERNIAEAVRYGALFEVNSAAFRKGWNSAYPGEDVIQVGGLLASLDVIQRTSVIQLIQKHNGHFALSDDSHGPHAVALNYNRLYKYLRRMEVNEIWYLQESDMANAAGRFVKAVKYDGVWCEDSFWAGKLDDGFTGSIPEN
jgi:histidinol-phosphatase (PHP family)